MKDPIKRAKMAWRRKTYRIQKNSDPAKYEKYLAVQSRWRKANKDKAKIWRRKALARAQVERYNLTITADEQRYYSKLVTALFRAQVEWGS